VSETTLFKTKDSITKFVIIKCSRGNGELEFSEQEGLRKTDGSEYFCVSIRSHNLSASSQVYAFDPFNNGLKLFFDDLFANWMGWSGEKKWSSLEGELSFVCTSDSLGHIEIEVTLENVWSVRNVLYVDAGQLQQIASDVGRFFSI
jgi:hypothetical protein